MRTLVKGVLETISSRLTEVGAHRQSALDGALVLAWHNIVPPGERQAGEHSLHLPWDDFVEQLDALQANADIRPLGDILTRRHCTDVNKPQVALTFDDAYCGAVETAIPELLRRGVPFTLFVTPSLLDGACSWWDRLAPNDSGALSPNIRMTALQKFRGDTDEVLSWARASGITLQELPEHARGARAVDVRQLAARPQAELGGHGWTHRNLAVLDESSLQDELVQPFRWIRSCGVAGPIPLAYPYGLHTPIVDRLALAVGYSNAFRVDGGWVRSTAANSFLRPRMNVPAGMSIRGFMARLGGWWPAQ